MPVRNAVSFLLKAVTAGLALAFVVVYLFPALLERQRPATGLAQPGVVMLAPAPSSYAEAVERAAPSVVNINTTKVVAERNPHIDDPFFQRFFGDNPALAPRRQLENSLGSGVIVSSEGYVLTNNHVIEGADDIQVALHDGRNAKARVVGTDPETDIAVLRIDLKNMPAITIGDSEALRVGDVVLAIGNPYGVGQTVTQGIVSATGRNHLGLNTFEDFIQTDAAINPGNSGGALIDSAGRMIGINSVIFSRSGGSQGIGFAIPLSLAQGVMQQIIKHGHAVRGWLGVEMQEMTPALAESFGLTEVGGVIVAGVLRGGPAAEAGMRPGDVVLSVNDSAVNDPTALVNMVARVAPGTSVRLRGVRDGKDITFNPRVSERPTPTTRQP